MRIPLVASSVVLLFAACATDKSQTATPAQPAAVEVNATGTPGQAVATRSRKLSATVESVDAATRSLTLKGPDGVAETIKVPPEVKRFDEIAAGDTVEVELEQGLLLEYQPAGTDTVEPQAVVAGASAPPSKAPGVAVAGGVTATVTVTAIDAKTRVVSLQGPRGNVHQVKAGPQIQLEKLKVGDRLLATYVEAVAVRLQKASTKL